MHLHELMNTHSQRTNIGVPTHLIERLKVFSTLWGCLCAACVAASLLPPHQLEILDTTADVIALAIAVTTSVT